MAVPHNHAVLEEVRNSAEFVIEQDHRPIAAMKTSPVKGRNISEVVEALALALTCWRARRIEIGHGIQRLPGI